MSFLAEQQAKTKWKSLKDSYRIQLRKKQKKGIGKKAVFLKSSWAYFDNMEFVRDTISRRKWKSIFEFQPQHQETSAESVVENKFTFEESTLDDDNHISSNAPIAAVHSSRKRIAEEDLENAVKLEPTEQATVVQDACNVDMKSDDYHFFMSLIPHMATLNSIQKLKARMQIQQVVIDALCGS